MSKIEQSPTYKAIEARYYKDVLLEKISLEQLADEHIKNIVQDKDRGAKNKAIEMALNKAEPEKIQSDGNEKVMVVLRG